MLTKNQARFIASLRMKKNRDREGLFIAEGVKIVNDILHSGIKVRQLYSSSNFQLSIFNHQVEVVRISGRELKKISSLHTPNEVLAVCEIPRYTLDRRELENKLILVLDTVQDPGNMGTLVRVADWFGINTIICSADTVEVYNPKVIQATMGSISRVKVHYTGLAEFLAGVHAGKSYFPVYGAFPDGKNMYLQKPANKGMLVMGNESKGISENLLPYITEKISIPNYGGGAESLNVAVAAAVICAEFRRNL